MSFQEDRAYVQRACQALRERGWYAGQDYVPSAITEADITAFEEEYGLRLPELYRTFLMEYRLPVPENSQLSICAVADLDDLSPVWLGLNRPERMDSLIEIRDVMEEIREFCELPENCFQHLVPIGDWGCGWGTLCIDLTRSEDKIDLKDDDTWTLVWFDHEEFDWDENSYLGEDGLLHGEPALPDFRMLLEWYFLGSLEPAYEKETGVKPTHDWYQALLKK